MLPTPCYVFGDAHVGIAPKDAELALLAFLRQLPGRARSVIVMGDLFDFWFGWKHVMPRTGFRALSAIADLRDAGVDVLWIGGNHDCWGGDAIQAETGATYTLNPWTGDVGEWRVHLAHGDGLRVREDAPYRRLRRVLRNPLAIRAFGWLHPNTATQIAMASSNTSRHRHAGDEGRGLLAIAALEMQSADSPALVIHGHSHVPMLTRAGHGVYANAGAWYLDRQFLRITDARIDRLEWTGSGEGNVLDSIDRPTQEPTP